ncbi:MAG: ABC transporter permease, partial [Burkholderiales bacterium]|nr:ABC transporter permease [Burkholderiales bacterium]
KATRLPWLTTLRLAYRNAQRQTTRSASVVIAVAFGTAGLLLSQGFIEDVFYQLGEAIVHSQSGHIQLAKGGYYAYGTHQPDKYLVSDPEGDKKKIGSLPQVQDVMARLSFSGLLNNGKADLPVIGEGVEPGKEEKLSSFLKLSAGRRLNDTDHYSAIIGHGVAKALQLKPGDHVVMIVSTSDGAMNTLDLTVVGVFQTFSKDYDNRAVKIPLGAAQELLNTNSVNTLVITLNSTSDTHPVASTLIERTVWRGQEVRTWDQLNDFYPKTVEMYERQFGGLRVIILLMILLGVVNAVNSSVFERTAEFGTARALGNRSSQLFRQVLVESILLGFIGVGIGIALGMGIAIVVSEIGIPMPPPPNADLPYIARIRLTPAAAWTAAIIGFSAVVLAALVPAYRATRIDVAAALRQSV